MDEQPSFLPCASARRGSLPHCRLMSSPRLPPAKNVALDGPRVNTSGPETSGSFDARLVSPKRIYASTRDARNALSFGILSSSTPLEAERPVRADKSSQAPPCAAESAQPRSSALLRRLMDGKKLEWKGEPARVYKHILLNRFGGIPPDIAYADEEESHPHPY
ncbi:hypothetical protein FQA47_008587 [Oryzias melastigma]|uniref:Uncharacterized protein n=1 Tax=Oryzias melastigma TaxID=30732 RepID=A0A834F2B9_ORYME|nr:hypothetical protein FQA47_008587 [Oryzias melastigma]